MTKNELSDQVKEALGSAEAYERERVPALFRPLAEFFLDHLSIDRGSAVLDIACGTGIVVRVAAERTAANGTFVGVDIHQDMIDVARKSTIPQGAITYHVGNVTDMPFLGDDYFDWVLCQQGFQFFDDKPAALEEIYRVLKPGGKLAMIMAAALTKEVYPFHWAEVEALGKYVGADAAKKVQYPIWAFDGSEGDLRALMMGAGLQVIQIQTGLSKRVRGFPEEIVTEDDYPDLDPNTRAAVVAHIRKAVEPLRTKDGTEVQYGFHIAVGQK